ncbi:MAG: M48 family metallopeptidase [Deltaproteobacteria bacterium]|jgi:STE24 endopeptidase
MISFNACLIAYISVYLLSVALCLAIEGININYLNKYGQNVPVAFQGVIHDAELKNIIRYTSDNFRFKFVRTGAGKMLFLLIIISGVLPWFDEKLANTEILSAGLIFFAVIGLGEMLTGLPFDYYHSFVIEERYGFNTKTIKIWISDLVKGLLVMTVLGGFLLSALLLMLKYLGENWWIWAWAVFLCFQLLMTVLYPTLIAPLFNTFTPLEAGELKTGIKRLAQREGLDVEGIYQMDATRRTRHTNAYFSGLGKAKRIVLFDSLIQCHSQDEIISILAHEIGHLKKNHIKKQILINGFVSLLLFFLAAKLMTWEKMYESFGFSAMSGYVGLFLVGILWEPANFFLSPVGRAISRKFEREADFYSLGILKTAKPLVTALKKMAKENLSNLSPHPLYVFFNYSHPPLLERIEYLETGEMSGGL